jgi:hypothetical protein
MSNAEKLTELKETAVTCWAMLEYIHDRANVITESTDAMAIETSNWIDDIGDTTVHELLDMVKMETARGWLDNLSMMAQDAGAPRDEANIRAAEFMNRTFGTVTPIREDGPQYPEIDFDVDNFYPEKLTVHDLGRLADKVAINRTYGQIANHINRHTDQIILADINVPSVGGWMYSMDVLQSIKKKFDLYSLVYIDNKVDESKIDLSSVGYIINDMTMTASSLIIDVSRLDTRLPVPSDVKFIPIGTGVIDSVGNVTDYTFCKVCYEEKT